MGQSTECKLSPSVFFQKEKKKLIDHRVDFKLFPFGRWGSLNGQSIWLILVLLLVFLLRLLHLQFYTTYFVGRFKI